MLTYSGIVKLNIGGTMFQTTEFTLTRFDGFFKTMLETDIPVTKDDSGAFLIDRSPKHFDTILNFMRDGDVQLPTCEMEIKEISKEAQYYLLSGLVELCSKRPQVKPSNELFKILNSQSERDSAVVNSQKPVLVFYTACSLVDFVAGRLTKLKQFIEKHSPKWNIFFSNFSESLGEEEKNEWCIHSDGKTFTECSVNYYEEKYSCGHRFSYNSPDTYLIHLEYHMNRWLTHPENMDMKYEEYSRFLRQ